MDKKIIIIFGEKRIELTEAVPVNLKKTYNPTSCYPGVYGSKS